MFRNLFCAGYYFCSELSIKFIAVLKPRSLLPSFEIVSLFDILQLEENPFFPNDSKLHDQFLC
jgi:hypothetical protein